MYYNPITMELIDLNGKKINPWKEKKKKSLLLSQSYQRLNFKKWDRVESCSQWLEFRLYSDESLKLNAANFCKDRLCPLCAWRRSLKIFGQVSKIMNYIDINEPSKYLFLTLTVRNCFKEDLQNTIDTLFYGYKRLFQRKEVKKMCKGTFRALEITFNQDTGTFHPHIHVIIATDRTYRKNHKDNIYISHENWKTLWSESMDIDYEAYVDIRSVKKQYGSIAEVAKYTAKDKDYLDQENPQLTDYLVETFDMALKGRRLIGFNGIFRKAHKLLNLDDAIDGDLTLHSELREDLDYIIVKFAWNAGIGNYTLYKE